MPCHTVNLVSVEFKAKSEKLLLQALDRLGWSYSYDEQSMRLRVYTWEIDLKNETAVIENYQQDQLNNLKRAYSMEVVKEVAAKRRWVLKQARLAANATVARKFQARRY